MIRTCYYCDRAGGKGPRELRPYGPNGSDVCHGCIFGEDGTKRPEREAEAARQLGRRLVVSGLLVLDVDEQAGPRQIDGGDA